MAETNRANFRSPQNLKEEKLDGDESAFEVRKSPSKDDTESGDLGGNSPSDVAWLCSLSESEIDFLVNLKILVIQHAKSMGAEHLAENFDLKMIRALGLILMDYLKEEVKGITEIPELAARAFHLDGCNLLKLNHRDAMNVVEMKACLDTKSKKGFAKRPTEGPTRKQKRQKKQSTSS